MSVIRLPEGVEGTQQNNIFRKLILPTFPRMEFLYLLGRL